MVVGVVDPVFGQFECLLRRRCDSTECEKLVGLVDDSLLEIGITVDILRGIFLGRLDESLLGEHALHGGV